MKTEHKPPAAKSPPKVKTVAKGSRRTAPKANGKYPLATYEHIPVGIVEASLDGKYMDVNEEFCRILGYSRKELLRRGIKECTHEDDYAIDIRLYEQLVAGKIPFYRIEKRYIRKDGGIVWVELTRSLVSDTKRKPLYTVGVVLDISDRKDVERVLRDSAERLRLATGAAQMFMWEWDFQTESYTIADNFEHVLGFSAGLLPKNKFETVLSLSPEEDVRRIAEAYAKAVEARSDLHAVPCRVINPENGQVVWLEISAKIVYDSAGKPERMFGVAQNVTAGKRMEDTLRESEERFRAMVSQTNAGIAESDMEGRFVFVNPGLGEMLGYSQTELLGKTIWELTYAEDLGENKRLFERMLERGESYQFEKRFIRSDGSTLWTSVSVTTIHDLAGKPKGGVGVVLNIEKRKRAEAALADYARQQAALYRLSDQLHRTESLTDVFDAALDAILNGVQCERASILLFDENDVMRFVAWRGLSDAYRSATDGHSPWTPEAQDPQPIAMADVGTAELSEELRAVIQGEGIGALAFIPLISNGKLIGKFMVYFNSPHVFNEAEIDLSLTIARQLSAGIDRKRAEEALARERETLARLFETMPVMVSMSDPESDTVRLNAEFERRIGWKSEEVTVSSLREALYPDPHYRREALQRVAQTGRNEWVELRVRTRDGRILDSMWSNISIMENQKLVMEIAIGIDITERKHTEKRLALLAEISELLRNVDDPHDLMYDISRAVGEHLNVKRALFNEIDLEHNREIVHHDYHQGLDSVAGVHKVSDYSSITSAEVAAGQTVVNYDSKTDPRTAGDYERTYAVSGERSYVVVPLMRDSRWVASLWVSDNEPRQWTTEEVSLLETVAERTWAIVEKLRIDTALRASEHRFREIFETAGVSVWVEDFSPVQQAIDELRAQGVGDLRTYLRENPDFVRRAIGMVRILDVNNETLDLFNARNKEELLRSLSTIFTPHAEEVFVEEMLALAEGRETVREETQVRTLDGKLLSVLFTVHFAPLTGDQSRVVVTLTDITERKAAEEALRESEQRYRAVVESQAEMLCRFQSDGTILFVNGAYARARGTTPEALESQNFWEFVSEEDRSAVKAMLDSLTPEAPQVQIENRFSTTEGERWTLWTNRALRFDANGRWLEAQSSGIDITERKQVEEALRASEERMRLATDAAGMYAWEYDVQTQSFALSDNFAEVLEIAPDLIPANNLEALLQLSPAEDAQLMQQAMASAFERKGDVRELQYRVQNPDTGQVSWVEVNARTIYDQDGKPERMYGVSQNITERKQIEAALRESEERYRFIVENTSDGIWLVELNEPMPVSLSEDEQVDWYYKHAVMRQCNLGLARMYGYDSVDQVVGLPMRMLMPREVPENIDLLRRFVRAGYRLVDAESHEIGGDGRELIFLNNMVGIVENDRLMGEWGTNRDITERKRAEQSLRASEALYRTIARSIPDGGVYVVDKDFRYLVAEGPVTEAFGLSREILEGRTVMEVFPDERGRRMEERLRRTFAGESVDFETHFNKRYYWTQMAPVHDSLGQVIILTLDVTERRQAEEALRQSEERFARFMQHLPALAWIKDQEGRYVYANAAAEKAFNLPREQLYGRTDEDIFPPEIAGQFRRNDEQALTDEGGVQVVETLAHVDGVLHSSLVSKFPIPGPDGSTTLIGGTAFDITERLRAEEALRESEERFRAILRQATAGIVRKDAQGRLLFVNEAFCNMLGYTEAELTGKSIWDFMYPDDVQANQRLYERLVQEGIPFKLERRFLRRDGSVIWVDASVSPIMEATGKPQSAVAVEVDITGRKQAEEALRESEERFRAILRQATAGIARKDREGTYIFINQAYCKALGYSEFELLGKTCWDVTHPDDVTENRRLYTRMMAEGIPFKMEKRLIRKDGTIIWVDVSVSPIMDAAGKPQSAVAVEVDITGRKHAEEALRQLNLQLEDRVLSRTARLRSVNQALREEIGERQRVEEALRQSEALARANEEKLKTLFELLPVGISFLDPHGRVLQVNPALTNIMKLSREQLSDQAPHSRKYIRANGTLMPSTEFASRRALSEGKTVYNVETGMVLEDGAVVWTSVSAAPVKVADVGAVEVTVDITESKRAEQALQESRERLQVLSQRLVEVQEEERRAIARELHDRVGQTLAALNINLIIISGQLGGKVDEQISSRLSDSMKLVAETISLVRDVMSNLRPSVLDDYGLESAIDSHLNQFTSRYGIEVRFEKPDQPIPRLGPSIEMTFLRIAQEALMNIAKHAQASQVTLALQREQNAIYMAVQDNGSGIASWQDANRPGSHGLTIMRERAEAFGGHLKVSSAPGKGTKVEVRIPVETNDSAQIQEGHRK